MVNKWKRAEPIRRSGPRIGRNSPCPCGSTKKFKQCCGQPAAPRTYRIPKQHADAAASMADMQVNTVRYAEAPHTQPEYIDRLCQVLADAKIKPEVIHAFRTTGLYITKMNATCFTAEQLATWNAAIEEYHNANTATDVSSPAPPPEGESPTVCG